MKVIYIPMSDEAIEGFKKSGFELYEENGNYKIKSNDKIIAEFGNVERIEKFFEKIYKQLFYTCEE